MDKFWMGLGFAGTLVFGARFVVQWLYSEMKKKSLIPMAFWYLSIIGSLMVLSYAIYKKDPVFIFGNSLNLLVYIRNIFLARNKTVED